jgi:hypothetical protein
LLARRSDTVPALWVAPGVIAVIAPPRAREGTVALSVCALRAAAGAAAPDAAAAAHAQPGFAPLCAPVAFEYREAWRGAPESASAFCAPQASQAPPLPLPAQSHISFAVHPCVQLQLQAAPAAAPLPVPLMSLFQAAHAA